MKYVGIYWTLFAPLMKKSIRKRFSKELADRAIRQGKSEYRGLLSRADDLGPGNPMAMNAYFAYVFAGAWLGSRKEITPDEMALVMTDVLESRLLRTVFGMTDMNRTPKKWERDMRKYEAWYKAHGKDYPVNWEGIAELMPALCSTDEVMFRLQHGKLYREHTIANGDGVCDYWVVGDKVKNPK